MNSLSKLNSLNCTVQKVSSLQPSLIDIDTSDDEEEDCSRPMPHFDSRSKLFELDSCDPYGTVVLVYNVQTKKGAAGLSTELATFICVNYMLLCQTSPVILDKFFHTFGFWIDHYNGTGLLIRLHRTIV